MIFVKDMATQLEMVLSCLLLFTLMEEAEAAVDASLEKVENRLQSLEDKVEKREEFHCK